MPLITFMIMSRVIIATLIRVKVEEVNADVVKTEKKKNRKKNLELKVQHEYLTELLQSHDTN